MAYRMGKNIANHISDKRLKMKAKVLVAQSCLILCIEPLSRASPALAGGFFTPEPPGKPHFTHGSLYMSMLHSLLRPLQVWIGIFFQLFQFVPANTEGFACHSSSEVTEQVFPLQSIALHGLLLLGVHFKHFDSPPQELMLCTLVQAL